MSNIPLQRPPVRILALPLLAIIAIYRYGISPLKPATCRYVPSCSEYAREALYRHGAAKGSWLILKRLSRCHPWGGFGLDEVPPHQDERNCHHHE